MISTPEHTLVTSTKITPIFLHSYCQPTQEKKVEESTASITQGSVISD